MQGLGGEKEQTLKITQHLYPTFRVGFLLILLEMFGKHFQKPSKLFLGFYTSILGKSLQV